MFTKNEKPQRDLVTALCVCVCVCHALHKLLLYFKRWCLNNINKIRSIDFDIYHA
jgi:hypothetical protein